METVLETFEDGDCRCILQQLQQSPMSATELSECCDVAQSTVYRKLDSLEESGLVSTRLRLDKMGRHTTEYDTDLQNVRIECGAEGIELVVQYRETDGQTNNRNSLTQSGAGD